MTMQAITKFSTLMRLLVILTLALTGGRMLAESAGELAERADVFDRKLKAAEALELYLQMEKLQPENAAVLVGIARQYRHLMADAPSTAEKRRLGNLAMAYGERAAILAPEDSTPSCPSPSPSGKCIRSRVRRNRWKVPVASRRRRIGPWPSIRTTIWRGTSWAAGTRALLISAPIRRGLGELLYGKLPRVDE